MKAQNILVFPCGSEIGLEIHRALSTSIHCRLFGASSVSSNHGKYLYRSYVEGLPYVDSPDFIDGINRVVDEFNIDFLFPAHDSVVLSFADHREDLHCALVGSPRETCRICRSKRCTYEEFAGLLRVPEIWKGVKDISQWPVFMKPDVGQGSRGVRIARSFAEAEFYAKQDSSLIILEYLPGDEYTVDCFTDRHGDLRFAGVRPRIRIMNGISVDTRTITDHEGQRMAEIINGHLELRGAWFFQFKRTQDGEPALMEIAPRIAGSMALYRNLGVNFALLSVFDAMDQDVEILCNGYDLEMDRALNCRFRADLVYGHLYIDLDDCLVLDGKVNLEAAALVFQCVNRGVKVHLLTRHAGSPVETLERHRLQGLFDDVIHVGPDDRKSDYLKHRDAVFIDDSYRERKDVLTRTGIPVFAPDAIESLLG